MQPEVGCKAADLQHKLHPAITESIFGRWDQFKCHCCRDPAPDQKLKSDSEGTIPHPEKLLVTIPAAGGQAALQYPDITAWDGKWRWLRLQLQGHSAGPWSLHAFPLTIHAELKF